LIRVNDFKAIEAAILKNKAYNELINWPKLPIKLSKSMLAEYELGLMYEKQEDFKKLQTLSKCLADGRNWRFI
jgi:hypothetical protein